ncbi:MAG: NAD-dependent epimerase/dehydratase family protein, partial [Candidatus Aminicenantaceae bacterium]
MIRSYLRGKWHLIPGDGQKTGNYVYIDDVVNGHASAMEKGRPGEHYLLGGENITYQKFFFLLKTLSRKNHFLVKIHVSGMMVLSKLLIFSAEKFNVPPPITPAMVRKLTADWMVSSRKAEQELTYSPVSLREGLQKTISWLRFQPRGFQAHE